MEYYTPPQVAKMLKVSRDKVLNWIRQGKLNATNVSASMSRPLWRVSEANLEEFKKLREPVARMEIPRVRTRRPKEYKYSYFVDTPEMGSIKKEIATLREARLKAPPRSKERKALYTQEKQKKCELAKATERRSKLIAEQFRS